MKKDTICALCTPRGKGAISLIRISGPRALKITRKLARFLPLNPESHRAYFGVLQDGEEKVDQVLVTYFSEGNSFTGEEVLEISCHGGAVYSDILKSLLSAGARLAERGEFSFQAFSNGKMDLIQAEGLLQLIESKNKISRRQSFSQLRGLLSRKIKQIEKKWIFLLSHLEADIDFSLEGLDTFEEKKIKEHLGELEFEIANLLSRYRPFENLQRGLVFGIFGNVNSGKSSLFNSLIKEDKAVVSEEEGTTRDVVEGEITNPEGLNISLKDSAGFRRSQSKGEKRGQDKSRELFLSCDYKIVVLDSLEFKKQQLDHILLERGEEILLVFTKRDLVDNTLSLKELTFSLKKKQKDISIPPKDRIFFVSSVTGEQISLLRRKILSYGEIDQEDFLISNYRHYKALKSMEESLKNCFLILKDLQGEKDIIALELRRGLRAVYEILGKQIDDQILDCIFKEFCIGK